MKYVIFVIILLIVLSGCTINGDVESEDGISFKIICVDGVEYIHRVRGYEGYMAPHMKPDGTCHTCYENMKWKD